MNNKKLLQIEQIDRKLMKYKKLSINDIPKRGWIHAIRSAINMSLKQLGKRLEITPQSVKELEEREQNQSITLKTLREAGEALNMTLVYGFIPKEDSLKKEVENRAHDIALEIIKRTSKSMELEDQLNSKSRLTQSVKMKAIELYNKLPKYLWD
jgi:predicted DNA-binding mobile mystery protein A